MSYLEANLTKFRATPDSPVLPKVIALLSEPGRTHEDNSGVSGGYELGTIQIIDGYEYVSELDLGQSNNKPLPKSNYNALGISKEIQAYPFVKPKSYV